MKPKVTVITLLGRLCQLFPGSGGHLWEVVWNPAWSSDLSDERAT